MEQSLIAAVSGIEANQTYLDVIGSNIANANTTAYKAETPVFTDLLSQQIAGATAPPAAGGAGQNPIAIGNGVRVSSVSQQNTQGTLIQTNQPSDVAIQGNGYLIGTFNGQTVYTRAGNLTLDANGTLSTVTGAAIQGYQDDANGANPTTTPGNIEIPTAAQVTANGALESYSIGTDGTITGTFANGSVIAVAQIAMATFPNPNGLTYLGNSNYSFSANSGVAQVTTPGQKGAGSLIAGSLESSNVNLATELTDLIVGQEDYQANTKVISTTSNVVNSLMQLS
jgi:flagellar hook protein FlgE